MSKSSGLFGIPQLTCPEGFGELRDECVSRSQDLVYEACSAPPQRKRIVARIFDELSDELCRVADMAEFVRLAHPDPKMAQAAESACIGISGLVERLNTDQGLYEALRNVVESEGGDAYPEEAVDRHVAKLFLLDFQQCGIHLDDEPRQTVVQLNDRILQIGQQFAANTHKPRVVKKATLPPNIRHYFNQDGDNVILNGLQVDSPHDLAREAAYKIYYWEDPQQEELLSNMLSQRHDLAQLCGYETFAHRAMIESLAETPEKVDAFLHKLSHDLRGRVANDFETMLDMKRVVNPAADSFHVWDVPYFSMQARNNWFDLDTSQVAEYFSLGVCMEGLDYIFKRLYGVKLEVVSPDPGELWHSDVYKLAVKDVDNNTLGYIYCDFFSRTGKPYQDCHFTIRGGRLRDDDGSYQNPVVVLMLNLPSPGWTRPTLLTGAMVDNLFHEMGHAMHSMLARTKYQHVTGTRCSTDFAEVPSTLMEYFASDARVLHTICKHYKSGKKLPMKVLEKFCASKRVFSGVDIQTQLFYSLLDQRFHGRHPLGSSTTDILRQTHEEHHNLPYPEGTAWQHRFSHLVGYGARYYSYLMARSVASKIWQQFFQDDPFNSDNGAKYREECLSHGGGKPSHRLVSDFLGKEIEPSDLSDALIAEIEDKQESVKAAINAAS